MALYILRSGGHSKVGISDTLDKRLSAYNTHNPEYEVVRVFECEKELGREIETAIRQEFSDKQSRTSREWFLIDSSELIQAVERHLINKTKTNEFLVSASLRGHHRVPLPSSVYEDLQSLKQMHALDTKNNQTSQSLELKVLRQFAKAFDIGTFEWDLGPDVIHRLGPELCHFHAKSLPSVCANFEEISFPKQDHIRDFYELMPTASGHKIAICRARVSLPYVGTEGSVSTLLLESADYAEQIGWTAVAHDEWSWYWPGRTGLVLFQAKLPRAHFFKNWELSFKRWVIENERRLQAVRSSDQKWWGYVIEDIIRDTLFPLNLFSFVDYVKYLRVRSPKVMHPDYDEMRGLMLKLFNIWRHEKGLNSEVDSVPEERNTEKWYNEDEAWEDMPDGWQLFSKIRPY